MQKGREGMENWWQKPITALKGIGSKRAEAFARLEIVTIGDLLNFIPGWTVILIILIWQLYGN